MPVSGNSTVDAHDAADKADKCLHKHHKDIEWCDIIDEKCEPCTDYYTENNCSHLCVRQVCEDCGVVL